MTSYNKHINPETAPEKLDTNSWLLVPFELPLAEHARYFCVSHNYGLVEETEWEKSSGKFGT